MQEEGKDLLSSLVFSFNAVVPVFGLVGIGWFLKKLGMIDDPFIRTAGRVNFRTGLPALLFTSIYGAKGASVFDWKFVLFLAAGCLSFALILCLTVPRFVPGRRKASAIIHSVFKPNIIVLGFPLALMIFGKEHSSAVSMAMPVLIPVNNIASIVILSAFDPEKSGGPGAEPEKTLLGIVKNPLILASVAAVLLRQAGVVLPAILTGILGSLADMATPLALITLGAQLTMEAVRSDRGYVIFSALCKSFVMPLVLTPLAYAFGFRGYELAAAFLISASPSAVNSYMLAREMHSDEILTGEVILTSTLCSMFVLFFGVALLKALSVIP